MFRKAFTASIAAVALAGAVMTTTTSAEARYYRYGGYGGGALAAGIIGGLALGAIAASAARPVYACGIERRPVYNAWGDVVGFRRVRVC